MILPRIHCVPLDYRTDVAELATRQDTPCVYQRVDNHGGGLEYFALAYGKEMSVTWQDVRTKGWQIVLDAFRQLEITRVPMAGYISYEAGYCFESRWSDLPVPDEGFALRFITVPCWIECDAGSRRARICYVDGCPEPDISELTRVFLSTQSEATARYTPRQEEADELLMSHGEVDSHEYQNAVGKILEDIGNGRYYELNFTQRFRVQSRCEPAHLYARLSARYRPAYGFYLNAGDEYVCSVSPELFLHKSGEVIETRPIKGSYKNAPPAKDLEKLHAEHVMVVDLARNDLGRISDLEPVSVPEFQEAKSFGGLNHLESIIRGKTSGGLLEILRATLPAASITGAPKIEVVTAIAKYEKTRRGLYTGNCGWIWPGGDLSLNVAIRTIHAVRTNHDRWEYSFGGGGAIVADSDPAAEYQESLLKVLPLFESLQGCE